MDADSAYIDEQEQKVTPGGPNMPALMSLYSETVNDLNDPIQLADLNYQTRHCEWPGQSHDQRKHAVGMANNQPFPWEGASDIKVPTVDEICNQYVALDCQALERANIRAIPIEGGDLAKASLVSNFMRWLFMSQMTEIPTEAEILSNYRHERGLGILGVFWESNVQKTLRPILLADLEAAAPDVALAITEGLFTEELIDQLRIVYPDVSKKKARAMLQELRDTGETSVPVIVQQVNRPIVQAYALGDEIFVPPNTPVDIQQARGIFRRCLLSPEQARQKVITMGWDEEYVEEAIKYCRDQEFDNSEAAINNQTHYNAERLGLNKETVAYGLIEFVWAYQRLSDEDGVPGIYCTIFCPAAASSPQGGNMGYAKHELLGYRHGLYPFVVFPRELLSRLMLDSRGVPETGRGWQDAIKTEVDARRDHASISTCPPLTHPVGRAPGRIGPGAQVGERRPGEYGYMSVPPPPQASVEVQASLDTMVRRYYGLATKEDIGNEWQVKQQKQISTWLGCWKQVMAQVWALYEQYGPEEEWFRVIGAQSNSPVQLKKQDVSGKYDFYATFDVLSMDPETYAKKLETMGDLASKYDKGGVVDYSKFLQVAFSLIDPILAEQILVPEDIAAQREVADTQADIAKMWSGTPLDIPQNGINAPLRLQVITNWLEGTPAYPSNDVKTRLLADPDLRNRIEKYTEQLKFYEQQRQNAQIGRIGTPPAGNVG